MAELQPLRALRFDASLGLASLICPPFDTISPELQRSLYQRSPHNIVRIELGLEEPGDSEADNRHLRAASALNQWRASDILRLDDAPAFYAYDQYFQRGGRQFRRRALFARLRLEPWQANVVRPHERTFAPPIEDRLLLLRATRCNTSPVFLLYRDAEGRIASLLESAQGESLADFSDDSGQRHHLWPIADADIQKAIAGAFRSQTLYVADGHHRYETALAYRDECRGAGNIQSPDFSGESFALVALTAADDPGLLILPVHRLVHAQTSLEATLSKLLPIFDAEPMPSLESLLAEMAERGRLTTAVGLIAADSPELYLLTLLDRDAAADLMPADMRPAWRSLDAAVARYVIVQHALQIEEGAIAYGQAVHNTEDAEEALRQVRGNHYRYAILLNPVRPDQVMTVADAGQPMPQKSTFFYPKLPTGLMLNLLDA